MIEHCSIITENSRLIQSVALFPKRLFAGSSMAVAACDALIMPAKFLEK